MSMERRTFFLTIGAAFVGSRFSGELGAWTQATDAAPVLPIQAATSSIGTVTRWMDLIVSRAAWEKHFGGDASDWLGTRISVSDALYNDPFVGCISGIEENALTPDRVRVSIAVETPALVLDAPYSSNPEDGRVDFIARHFANRRF